MAPRHERPGNIQPEVQAPHSPCMSEAGSLETEASERHATEDWVLSGSDVFLGVSGGISTWYVAGLPGVRDMEVAPLKKGATGRQCPSVPCTYDRAALPNRLFPAPPACERKLGGRAIRWPLGNPFNGIRIQRDVPRFHARLSPGQRCSPAVCLRMRARPPSKRRGGPLRT